MPVVTDEDEEEVDTFHKMEAGLSDNRYWCFHIMKKVKIFLLNR